MPITYVWQATGQLPVTNTGGIRDAVTFTWNAPGVQAVTVTAMNEADVVTGIYGVAIYAPPQAAFAAAPTSGVAPMTVVFTNTSGGDYTSSRWEFGDGMTSTLPSPTHTYSTPGVYGVTLTVSAPGGTVIIPGGTTLLPAVSDTLARANYITVTVAQTAGASLTSNQNGMVYPGQSIVYQHTLTNTGTGADSFAVEASIDRSGWSVMTAPSMVGPLGPGIASSVVVTVTVPNGITTTVTATAHITATSKFDANVTSTVMDVTTAQPYQVYLPAVIRQ
jgi:PKD domain